MKDKCSAEGAPIDPEQKMNLIKSIPIHDPFQKIDFIFDRARVKVYGDADHTFCQCLEQNVKSETNSQL